MTERLSRVLWLGGSPCSGKSTIAGRIASRFGYRVLDCDGAWLRHSVTVSLAEAPVLYRLARSDAEEIWLRRPLEQQLSDTIVSYRELFPLILRDIEEMPAGLPFIAVGAALMPGLIAEAGIPLERALWMIPTEAFQRLHYGQRAWRHDVVRHTSDPGQAWENWMRRDAAFAQEVLRRAQSIRGRVIVIDGSRDLDTIELEFVRHLSLT